MEKKLTTAVCMVATGPSVNDIRYRTGFRALDPILYVEVRGEHHLVVPSLEVGRARQEAPATRIWNLVDLKVKDPATLADQAVALLAVLGVKDVAVPPFFPSSVLRGLETAGVRVDVAQASLTPRREVKDARELRAISEGQRAAVDACRYVVRRISQSRVGPDRRLRDPQSGEVLTSDVLRREVEMRLLARGFSLPDGCIIAGGRQAADPHDRGSGPLYAGQTIVIDIFPRHQGHGYWGDLTRTVIRGQPTPTQARMYRAVRSAQQLALSRIRAGVGSATVHRAVAAWFEQQGFPVSIRNGQPVGFFHGTGHGLGLDIHEGPSLSRRNSRLRVGHVVTVEPGLYDPEHGGIRIEDTVVVTRDGCRKLARCPYPWVLDGPGQ